MQPKGNGSFRELFRLGSERNYYLFDSYEGLPLATELDGKSAVDWQQNTASDLFYDNCSASEDDAREAMFMAKVYEPNIIKGWFENTLPGADIAKGIALLRMDGDWYDSTMHILKNLFHKVVPGGIIIIDDYYTWDGCSKAVHDYLSEEKRCERIRSFNGVCYIEKLDN
jgi:O-methyltransferase